MTLAVRAQPMTTEQLLALPDDGKERWPIAGEVREKETTRRNRGHSRVQAKIAYLLRKWMETCPGPRGEILVGEAGVRLRRNPDTTVGVDVAYFSADSADSHAADEGFIEAIPILVVEILSPSGKQEEINEKLKSYLAAGVKLVWIVDPTFQMITVQRGDAKPELFHTDQSIAADPHLPGFNVAVADVFSR
jgi:Uma2 family endonuclease